MLADSSWPKMGGDLANTRRWRGRLPDDFRIAEIAILPSDTVPQLRGIGSGALGPQGLVISHAGFLTCIREREIVWQTNVSAALEVRHGNYSPPTILEDGSIVVTGSMRGVLLSSHGEILESVQVKVSTDDSGVAPTPLSPGYVITCIMGDVHIVESGQSRCLGNFGYDIVPPAVFSNGDLLISGYGEAGLVRIGQDGRRSWSVTKISPDYVPTINGHSECAVGCKNQKTSFVVASDGTLLFRIPESRIFGVDSQERWVSASDSVLSVHSRDAQEIWSVDIKAKFGWGGCGFVVDRDDAILLVDDGELCAFQEGSKTVLYSLPEPSGMFPAGENSIAILSSDSLRILH